MMGIQNPNLMGKLLFSEDFLKLREEGVGGWSREERLIFFFTKLHLVAYHGTAQCSIVIIAYQEQ